MQGLEGGFSADTSLPVAQTERHRRALERLRAFVAVFEGYSSSAAGAVLPAVVADAARIDEGMARRKLSPTPGQQMLSGVLGVSLDRALETAGNTFCAAVIEMRGLQPLNRIWEAPDNLPSEPEIRDPFAWMERVLDDRSA